jgi:hypothetical protein
MRQHFRVRTIVQTRDRINATLDPVEWTRRTDPRTSDDPDDWTWEPCEPDDPDAEPFEPGGKTTEVRFERSAPDALDLAPDDYVTMTLDHTNRGAAAIPVDDSKAATEAIFALFPHIAAVARGDNIGVDDVVAALRNAGVFVPDDVDEPTARDMLLRLTQAGPPHPHPPTTTTVTMP